MPDDHGSGRFRNVIRTEADLRDVLGTPSAISLEKEVDHIDPVCRQLIAASPFVLLASADGNGQVDVSPKGDPAGFIKVLDDRTLAIPDRKGNRRADTHRNLLAHPHIGLLFLLPGSGITLRMSGEALLTADPDLLDTLAHQDRRPELATVVTVNRAYIHCAKCMIRSELWNSESWPDLSTLPTMAAALKAHIGTMPLEEISRLIDESERNRLY